MKTRIFFGVLIVATTGFIQAQSSNFQSVKMEKLWIAEGLLVPESVLLVPEKKIMYVSNMGGNNASAKDSTGFISIIDFEGNIKNLKWVEGLNSPKGMGIYENNLYVSMVDEIAKINLLTGKLVERIKIDSAKFLNDIAISNKGVVYVSDSRAGTVYSVDKSNSKVLIHDESYPSVNGLLFIQEKLLLATGKKVVEIDVMKGVATDFISKTGSIDGIGIYAPGAIIASEWSGKVQIIKRTGEAELLLDSSSDKALQSADFGYMPMEKKIFIPTFFGNSVVAYQIR